MGCFSSKEGDSKASRIARWRSTGIVALRDSKLKIFPNEILDMDRVVRTIDLTNNKIIDIPMGISRLINMQRLILADNLIERLPVNLGKLQSLKVLTLDGNQMTTLPDELGMLVRLERLSISRNLLTSLPDTIGSLRSLSLLNVSNNKLTSLPESIGSCFSMEELQANDNYIDELPSSVCNLVHLKSLCLDNNNVKQIPQNILKDCKVLHNISLHDNPISMDQFQQMEGYQEFETRRKKKFDKQIDSNVMMNSKGLDVGKSWCTKGLLVMKRIMSFHLRFLRLHPTVMVIRILCFRLVKMDPSANRKVGRGLLMVQNLQMRLISSASIEASTLEEAGKSSFFPEVSEAGCSTRDSVQHDELYTALLNSPPQKLVPVGSDHQAIIPQCTGSNLMADNSNWEKLVGTCLLPMPDSEALCSSDDIGQGRADNCLCLDKGSIRCVQHHIYEARCKLKELIGLEVFDKLGFYEMGEIVARKWTEDEQQLFQKIVFANPASEGKNYWAQLPEAFPSRSMMDLVSYYFNVFMLRRRAEQNRLDITEIAQCNNFFQNAYSAVGACSGSQLLERACNVTELARGVDKEQEKHVPLQSVSCSTIEKDSKSETPVKLSFPTDVFEAGCSSGPSIQHDEIYSFLLNSPPRKLVPVGSDHQAVIPEYGASNLETDSVNLKKLIGTCVLPLPDQDETVANYSIDVGRGRPDYCTCSDRGAIRCVQCHIFEARDKLRESIGRETFAKLGFYEMGEIVARKWTEEEQQIFQNVVYLNPASYGKNFWTQLREAFPSRSKMELVSYYFNVFMLRKRAEQNRSDWMNVDSDDDEWQRDDLDVYGIMSGMGGEVPMVESEGDQEDDTYNSCKENDDGDNWFVLGRAREEDGVDDDVPTSLNLENRNLKKHRIGSVDTQDDQHDGSCTSNVYHLNGTGSSKQSVS
ncbi:hypothetical protein MKW94_007411 [Papaver nudicaule]|uniref:Uncharacterized protein n=1 Tax=Papaver nudicaule TaxID=74823 RepID=A0AA41VLM8_PAPNU|nr:hypothetical protein [Papaver nudicaule]